MAKISLILGLFNLFLVSVFFFLRWRPYIFDNNFLSEKIVVGIFALLSIFGLSKNLVNNSKKVFLIVNLNILAFILILVVLEVMFTKFPSLIPKPLVNFAPYLSPQLRETRVEVLEYLDESPWIKFKPNVTVDIEPIGARGRDVTHSWQTDSLGFKNKPELANWEVAAVAIGDSFVEGMGVEVDKTWTSVASDNGFIIYNMGVQGYAPQQIGGALIKYGEILKPKYVIWGYTPGFEHRSLAFIDYDPRSDKFPLGGIAAVDSYTREIRAKEVAAFKVLNALIDYYENYFFRNFKSYVSEITGSEVDFYKVEVDQSHKSFNWQSQEFELTRQSLMEAYKFSQKLGAKFVILIFYHRPTIYAEKFFGQPLSNSDYELAVVKEVKRLASENNIDVIDTYEPLKNYVDKLPKPVEISQLPYFARDGHLNEIGNEIVARAVVDYFKDQQQP